MREMNIQYSNQKVKVLLFENEFEEIEFPNQGKFFIISDDNVAKLYLNKVLEKIPGAKYRIIKAGEKSKNLKEAELLLNELLNSGFSKGDYLVGLGGGVIGDLAGFVASIYKRGMKLILIPTSLIGQVDSALGGKTGINFSNAGHLYKNQIGSIYHPELILVNPTFLKTLPQAEFLSGFGEIIKYGLCFERTLFYQLFESFSLPDIIWRSLEIKAEITARDEFDNSERIALNYGHTIGHSLESLSGFCLRHGEAIALGMYYETRDQKIRQELKRLYQIYNFPDYSFDYDDLIDYLKEDKKINKGLIRFPVLEAIGKTSFQEMDLDEFLRRIS